MKQILFTLFYLLASPNIWACKSLDDISWLLGDWQSYSQHQDTLESWHKASDSTFEGISTAKKKHDLQIINNESLRIVQMSGEIFYIAKVKHNALPTTFKLSRCSTQHIVFENNEHDFPKRIIYKMDNNTLIARAENNKDKGFTITFTKSE